MGWIPSFAAITLLIVWSAFPISARAQQYRSEVREVAPPRTQSAPVDLNALLKSATDPYQKAMILRELAAGAAQRKNYSEARRLLEQAIKLNALSGPAAEMMKQELATLIMALGDIKDQIPALESLVRGGSAAPEVMAALGAAYVQNKRFKEAVPLLKKAIAAQPGKPDITWRMALIAALIGAGQYAEATAPLEQVLGERLAQRDSWLQLAALHLKGGNKERARSAMEIASRLGYLSDSEDRLRLVTLTGQLGAPFEAGALLQGWMRAGQVPRSAENLKLLAALWVRARERRLALPVLQEMVAARPSRELYEQIAQLQLERQDYPHAVEAMQQAIQMGGASGPVLVNLGLARYQMADVDGATDAFRQAAAFAPQKDLAKKWLDYLRSGRAREMAIAAAGKVVRSVDEVRLSSHIMEDWIVPPSGAESGAAVAGTGRAGESTPVGAERGGNRDGSIPPWTGGLARSGWPAAFAKGKRLVDPFPNDRPLFTITASNVGEYRSRLSRGHQALLARHPNYRLPVYASRRSVAYPQTIYDATQANLTRAKLVGSDAIQGARLGFPFPNPKSGVEAMWNHRVRYRGDSVELNTKQVVINANGKPTQDARVNERAYFRYGNIADPVDINKQNILLYYLLRFTGVGLSRLVAVAHETANSEKDARAIWVAPPGSPRLFRIPPVGYDQPFPGTEGIYFVDMIDMYNGPFDRYVWKLVGKREMYLPYNAYRLSDGRQKYAQQLMPSFFNPDQTRYELHRVWVVEATERDGKKHSFGTRVFYLDEDSWNVVLVENEDHQGKLWRFQEGHILPSYEVQSVNCFPVITYDLKDGRYYANRLLSEEAPPRFDVPMEKGDFLPATIQAKYLR